MNIFYTQDINGNLAVLPEEEARHCLQVLRYRIGDRICFIDGQGGLYYGDIVSASKKSCQIAITEAHQAYGKRPFRLHLALAPTKNISRTEWLLEKAAELGLDTFTPLICEHSERRALKPGRLEKIVLSAAKQSVKAYLPSVQPMQPLADFLKEGPPEAARCMAYLGEGTKGLLKDNYLPGKDVCLLVGPEGGFSPREAALAQAAGFVLVSLGDSRLRTETAGLIACHTIHLINQ